MAPQNLKIKKACDAMKFLDIPESKVKSVLKKLLKTYDNKWGLIEDNNYTALAEALLDDDAEASEKKKKKEVKKESKVVAVNRGKRKAHEQTQALVVYKEDDESEEDEVPLMKRVRRKPTRLGYYNGDNSLGSSMAKKAKEKDPKLTQREEEEEEDEDYMPELSPLKRYLRRSSFNSPMSREPEMNSNTGALVILEDDPLTDPKPMIPENTSTTLVREMGKSKTLKNSDAAHKPMVPENSSALVLGIKKPKILVKELNGETEETLNDITAVTDVPSLAVEETREHIPFAELELASSSSGEAKISLSFAPQTGEETKNLRLPSMEELRRAMEEKYLHTYKIVHPGFSVPNFMKDMCSCFIELATNPTKQSLETKTVSDAVDDGSKSGLTGLVVVPECEISPDGWRAITNIQDITFGEEDVMIPWKNEINDDFPSVFRYIPQSVLFRDAAMKFFSLSSFSDEQGCFSSCTGECFVSSSSRCSCTSAYTVDGLLKDGFLEDRISEARDQRKQVLHFCKECPIEKAKKEETLEPCKGHIQRKSIKECWIKCGCTKRCGNRTVQRGIHNKLEVFYTTNGKGWGIRTLEKLRKGAFVCEYIGEILTVSEISNRSSKDEVTSTMILDAFWGSEESVEDNKALCLDGTRYGNISRFLNHRCLDANLIEIPVHIETPDQHYYHLAFFTTRDIEAMEELTWDYGVDFDDDDSLMKPFDCLCGSRCCRNIKRSKKAKNVMKRA